MSQETVDEDLKEAFTIFDEDGDGYISPDEIQLLFKKLGELITTDEAVDIMKDCDLNQDGLIDFDGNLFISFIHSFIHSVFLYKYQYSAIHFFTRNTIKFEPRDS